MNELNRWQVVVALLANLEGKSRRLAALLDRVAHRRQRVWCIDEGPRARDAPNAADPSRMRETLSLGELSMNTIENMAAVETIRAALMGRDHVVGIWRGHPVTGRFGPLRAAVRTAQLAVAGFEAARRTIDTDVRLSDTAKAQDRTALAKAHLAQLAEAARELWKAQAAIDAEGERLLQLPQHDGDPALAAVDLALAEHLRGLPPSERVALLAAAVADERIVAAVLRLPRQLSGVTQEQHERIRREAVERLRPVEAREHEALREAASDADEAVRRAFELVAGAAGLSRADRREAAGEAVGTLMPASGAASLPAVTQ